jgi:disulfide oxidoreductase YuzD
MHSVVVVGSPVVCKDGIKESWREVTAWVAEQLQRRFEDRVSVQYFDLFDPECPAIPPDGQLPLVFVDGKIISSGGKISVPLLRKTIEELD